MVHFISFENAESLEVSLPGQREILHLGKIASDLILEAANRSHQWADFLHAQGNHRFCIVREQEGGNQASI